jgi:hypothetical protein
MVVRDKSRNKNPENLQFFKLQTTILLIKNLYMQTQNRKKEIKEEEEEEEQQQQQITVQNFQIYISKLQFFSSKKRKKKQHYWNFELIHDGGCAFVRFIASSAFEKE